MRTNELELGQFIEKAKKVIVETMVQNFREDQLVSPVALIITRKKEIIPVMMQFENDFEKDLVMGSVKVLCQQHDAIALALITEAWVVYAKTEDKDEMLKRREEAGGIVNLPDRKEVVCMIFETKLTTHNVIFDIDRQKMELTNRKELKGGEGRFMNILNPIISKN